MSDLTLELENIRPEEIWALAQFVKRVGWSEIRVNAVNDDDAYNMRDAISKLQDALAKAGYTPR